MKLRSTPLGSLNSDIEVGDRVFDIHAGADFAIEEVNLQGGNSASNGGAMRIIGAKVALLDVSMRENSAAVSGGSIYSDSHSELSIEYGRFSNGSAGSDGGGIYSAGKLEVNASRFSGLSAHRGGAVFHTGVHETQIVDSNFVSNRAHEEERWPCVAHR